MYGVFWLINQIMKYDKSTVGITCQGPSIPLKSKAAYTGALIYSRHLALKTH